MTDTEGELICRRKVMYSYDAGVRALQAIRGGRGDLGLMVYHCPECSAYHLGHKRT